MADNEDMLGDLDKILKMGPEAFTKEVDKESEEAKKKLLERIKREMKELSDKSDDDFSAAVLRMMVAKGVVFIELLENEMKKEIYARDAEVAGQIIGQITAIVDKINHIATEKQKMELAKGKFELAQRKANGMLPGPTAGNVTNNVVCVGSVTDLIEMVRAKGDMVPKISAPVVDATSRPAEPGNEPTR